MTKRGEKVEKIEKNSYVINVEKKRASLLIMHKCGEGTGILGERWVILSWVKIIYYKKLPKKYLVIMPKKQAIA